MASPRTKPLKTGRTEAQVLGQVMEAAKMLGLDLARQNTGAMVNPRGQHVRFGEPGNSDLSGMTPDGRKCDIEVKREGFDPAKARGKERVRWEKQLARLRRTNEQGGIGFFTDDSEHFLRVMRLVLAGARVVETGAVRGPEVILP